MQLHYTRLVQHTARGPQSGRQALLSGPRGLPNPSKLKRHLPLAMVNLCCRNVKNDRFVSIRYVFQALKYAKTRFLPWLRPGPRWGAYDAPPDPLVGWGGGHPLPIPFPLDAKASRSRRPSVVWPPTSLKFVHLALQSKRLDIPALYRPCDGLLCCRSCLCY